MFGATATYDGATQQFNGREGETATLLSTGLVNSELRVGGFAPRHLSRSALAGELHMDTELRERISKLSDEELLEMVERKSGDYRKNALDYASEELTSRGISFTLANTEIEEDELIASGGKRFINFVLDYILILICSFVVAAFFGSTNGLLILLVVFLYYFVFETGIQKTPAKFVTRTKVVMLDGSKPDAASIAKRTLIRFIPLEPLFSKEGKWWHDRWSDTQVIRDQ